MDTEVYASSNINTLWLRNIFENIKNLENLTRLAREGCGSVIEYMQVPADVRQLVIGDVQYKNLKLIFGELDLLITDISIIIGRDKTEQYFKKLENVGEIIQMRNKFLKETYSTSKNTIMSSTLTPFFYETLKYLESIRKEVLLGISSILYIKDTGGMN